MSNLTPEAWIALIQGLFSLAEWAIKMWNQILENHASGTPPTPEQWAVWDAEALAAHNDIQRPRAG